MDSQRATGFRNKYKDEETLLELPFGRVSYVQSASGPEKYLCITYKKPSCPKALQKEMDLWDSIGYTLFPEVVESWETEEESITIVPASPGASLFGLVSANKTPLPENSALALLTPLLKTLKAASRKRIVLPLPPLLMRRIVQTPDGAVKLLPSIIEAAMEGTDKIHSPFFVGSTETGEEVYVKTLATLLCFLLTGRIPAHERLPEGAEGSLKPETAEFLKLLVSGGFKTLDEAANTWDRWRAGKAAEEPALETPEETREPASASSVKSSLTHKKALAQLHSELVSEIRKADPLTRIVPPILLGHRITKWDLVIFTRSLAVMVAQGIPLMAALNLLVRQSENYRFRVAIIDVLYWLYQGRTFAEALGTHPEAFSNLYVGMVRAGEGSGKLSEMLEELATHLEEERRFWKNFLSSLTYPLIVLSGALASLLLMSYLVLPSFARMFTDLHVPLPWPTRALVFATHVITSPFFAVGLVTAIVAGYYWLRLTLKTWTGKALLEKLLLRLPIAATSWKSINIVYFCHCMSTLYDAGIPLVTILKIFQKVTESPGMETVIEGMIENLEQGLTFLDGLVKSNAENGRFFPDMFMNIAGFVTETGEVVETFQFLLKYYKTELDRILARVLALLEPAVVFSLGITVGFMLISIFLPIYSLVNNFQ